MSGVVIYYLVLHLVSLVVDSKVLLKFRPSMQAVIDVDEDDLVSMRLQINYTNVGHVIPLVSGPHCFTGTYTYVDFQFKLRYPIDFPGRKEDTSDWRIPILLALKQKLQLGHYKLLQATRTTQSPYNMRKTTLSCPL